MKKRFVVRALEKLLGLPPSAQQHIVQQACLQVGESLKCLGEDAAILTAREREVCECVISGMINKKKIAAKLEIAERTVKAHRSKVMQEIRR